MNEKKIPSRYQARGPYQILEVIEPGAIFTGTITVNEKHAQEAGIVEPLRLEALLQSLADFYAYEAKRERTELLAADLPPLSLDLNDGLPMRIGRHSGAESVTIDRYRNIRIMQGRDTPPKFSRVGATTFWLAADSRNGYSREQLQPFGWATLCKFEEGILANDMESLLVYPRHGLREGVPDGTMTQGPQVAGTKTHGQPIAETPMIVKSPLEKILEELRFIRLMRTSLYEGP